MQKQAAPDPRFKAVKQHKKNWNKAMKELISRMIAFKRALNGTGDQKYALPASKLQQPIPPELTNFINTLSSNYEAVAADALKIIQEQNEFAKNRVPPAQKEASLRVDASSRLSRFWTYLKSPFLSEENKKTRITLLKGLADLERIFKRFEDRILSSKVAEAKEIFNTNIREKYNIIFGSFDSLVSLQQNPISSSENINTGNMEKLMETLKSVIQDMSFADKVPNIESPHFYSIFDSLVTQFNKESNIEAKKITAIKIIETYNKALRAANVVNKQTAKSFRELFERTKEIQAVAALSVLAGNFVSKWFKKKMMGDSVKLSIQETSEGCREIINELMDSLESDLDVEQTKTSLFQLNNNLGIIEKNLAILQNEKSHPKNKK